MTGSNRFHALLRRDARWRALARQTPSLISSNVPPRVPAGLRVSESLLSVKTPKSYVQCTDVCVSDDVQTKGMLANLSLARTPEHGLWTCHNLARIPIADAPAPTRQRETGTPEIADTGDALKLDDTEDAAVGQEQSNPTTGRSWSGRPIGGCMLS
jgi:hypothetical protein